MSRGIGGKGRGSEIDREGEQQDRKEHPSQRLAWVCVCVSACIHVYIYIHMCNSHLFICLSLLEIVDCRKKAVSRRDQTSRWAVKQNDEGPLD